MDTPNGLGCTIWFTGLPCSGKTTLAQLLLPRLTAAGLTIRLLDGDEVRKQRSPRLGFSREDRAVHLERAARLCQQLTQQGVVVLACFVSPYRENRQFARKLIGDRFVEIYVDAPVEVCIRRDVKGMYRKALAGEIPHFTGISDPYEPPEKPDLTLRTAEETPQQSLHKFLQFLSDRLGVCLTVNS